jgi:hypothetical protein
MRGLIVLDLMTENSAYETAEKNIEIPGKISTTTLSTESLGTKASATIAAVVGLAKVTRC